MPNFQYRHPANRRRYEQRTTGERMADRLSASFGSWSFILAQSVIVLVWIVLNMAAWMAAGTPTRSSCSTWCSPPRPTQAAYAAPRVCHQANGVTGSR